MKLLFCFTIFGLLITNSAYAEKQCFMTEHGWVCRHIKEWRHEGHPSRWWEEREWHGRNHDYRDYRDWR